MGGLQVGSHCCVTITATPLFFFTFDVTRQASHSTALAYAIVNLKLIVPEGATAAPGTSALTLTRRGVFSSNWGLGLRGSKPVVKPYVRGAVVKYEEGAMVKYCRDVVVCAGRERC